MFNVLGDQNAIRYQRYLLRVMEAQERRMRPSWFLLLQKCYADAAKAIEHGQVDMASVINAHRITANKMLTKNYRELMAYFGTFTFEQFKKSQPKNISPSFTKGMEEIYWQNIKTWSTMSALSKSKLIAKSTGKLIHILIKRGMEEGLSNQQIIDQLREKRKTFNKIRAARIVRTETHSASNKAINEAVKSTGYKHTRIWRATIDDRVRGAKPKDRFDHLHVNKQARDLNTPFDVSREKLDFPGDPKASPGNTVNCRCVITYHTMRSRS
jgi:hypothetical protein